MALFHFKGGIHAPHRKNTAASSTLEMPTPKKVYIPMVQHIGAACLPIVKKGDKVEVGQLIGNSDAFVSAPIHASVSGTVTAVEVMVTYGNRPVTTVVIESDGQQTIHDSVVPPVIQSKEDFVKAIRSSGLTGLGGAGFPAHVKLMPPKDKEVDTLIINAAECEPYITSDHRECIENTESIIDGIRLVMKWTGVKQTIIGIEDNKPDAIQALKQAASKETGIVVQSIKSLYPQGAERTLIFTLTGRKVLTGKLPSDAGCIVMNVGSVSFVAKYMKTGMPLTRKRLTIDGPVVKNPGNIDVAIGTPIRDVFEFCGGFKEEPTKVLMGGPMMGVSQFSLDVPVLKNNNALLAFDKALGDLPAETACMRCGKCASACPMKLMPMEINRVVVGRTYEELAKYNIMDCIECGCCSFTCPAKRHLVQSIRLGKDWLRRQKK